VIVPGPAATVLLVRDGVADLEVLLLERRPDSGFVPGAFVFPGGAVDPGDRAAELAAWADGPDDAEASRQLGMAAGGFAYRVAAIREAFEEAGVLLAHRDRTGADDLSPYRHALEQGEADLLEVCRRLGARLATSHLRSFAHWITPKGAPRRYDTRFFVAPMPSGYDPTPDGSEVVSARWLSPTDALARSAEGVLPLILPTERCLHALVSFRRVDDLLSEIDRSLASPGGPAYLDDHRGRRLALDDAERAAAGREPRPVVGAAS
jgi:8-oxo-dGTP pyrophosphatase MutT (NUDIX family)